MLKYCRCCYAQRITGVCAAAFNSWLLSAAVAVQVGHIAHLGGALAGVLLVWLLSKIPDPDAK